MNEILTDGLSHLTDEEPQSTTGEDDMTQFNEQVAQLDLGGVITRMQKDLGVNDEVATRAEDLYKKFLILKHLYPNERLVPPKIVDEFWHRHMLDSRKYQADCQELYGDFLHHDPNPESQGQVKTAWNRTKELYASVFGIDLDTISWNTAGANAAADCFDAPDF